VPAGAQHANTHGRRAWRFVRWLGRAAAGASIAVASGVAPAAPLTLALAELPAFAPALIAAAEGYFAAAGLELKILPCVNGSACMQLMIDGRAQLATVADIPLVLAAHAGVPFQIIATMGASARDHSLVARSDRGIRSPADLQGKRIGFVRGTSSHYFTESFLLYHGIARSSITLVALDPATAAEQLARGEVDAAGLYQPQGPRALLLLGAQGLTLPNPRSYTVTINVVAQPAVADEDLLRVLRALSRAEKLLDREPERARSVLAARLHLDRPTMATFWGQYNFRLALNQSLITTLEGQSRWALREGLVKPGAPPDFLDRLRPGPLKALNPRAVSVVN